jgi:hypothetical protein
MPIHHVICHSGAVALNLATVGVTFGMRISPNAGAIRAGSCTIPTPALDSAADESDHCGHSPTRGRFASVFLPALDDGTEAELTAAPLAWCCLHENGWNAPAETGDL